MTSKIWKLLYPDYAKEVWSSGNITCQFSSWFKSYGRTLKYWNLLLLMGLTQTRSLALWTTMYNFGLVVNAYKLTCWQRIGCISHQEVFAFWQKYRQFGLSFSADLDANQMVVRLRPPLPKCTFIGSNESICCSNMYFFQLKLFLK